MSTRATTRGTPRARIRPDRGGNSTYKGLRHVADETDVLVKADTTGEWTYRVGVDG
jgi:hypothetical protein